MNKLVFILSYALGFLAGNFATIICTVGLMLYIWYEDPIIPIVAILSAVLVLSFKVENNV